MNEKLLTFFGFNKMKSKPNVQLIAYSEAPDGKRLATFLNRYQRFFHSEVMTHRALSKNASSSRAVPVKKLLSAVWNDPAAPDHWGANQPGMQAAAELTGWRLAAAKLLWRSASRWAVIHSWALMKLGLHKQVANRVTEPYQWINVLVSGTEWDNLFTLRDHSDAQPEFRNLARAMRANLDKSKPVKLAWGEWHIPMVSLKEIASYGQANALVLSGARCAWTSYMTVEGKQSTLADAQRVFKKLAVAEPFHASPFEHAAQAVQEGDTRNFRSFEQFRAKYENGQITLKDLL